MQISQKVLSLGKKAVSKLSLFSNKIGEVLDFSLLNKTYNSMDKKLQNFMKSCVIMILFFLVAIEFPDGGYFLKKDNLVLFWFIPAFFIGAAVFMQRALDDGHTLNSTLLTLFQLTSSGTFLGLTYGSVVTLNNWYIDSETARWEPLFVATGLSTSGVYFTFKFFSKHLKANKNRET